MRKIILSTLLGVGSLGFIAPNDAKASWFSEAFNHAQIDVHVGPQYPAYRPAPVYVPAPVYSAPPAYPVYRPAPVYSPAYPVYRPATVYPPTYAYYPSQPSQTSSPAPNCAPPITYQTAPSYYQPAPSYYQSAPSYYQPRQANYGPYRYDPYQREGRDPRFDYEWRR